jgi:hypothetical protein
MILMHKLKLASPRGSTVTVLVWCRHADARRTITG